MKKFPTPADEDNRTIKQWVEDQGLEYITNAKTKLGGDVMSKEPVKLNISGVKWLNNRKSALRLDPKMISLSKSTLILGDKVVELLGSDRIIIGVGKAEDATVMLLKPSPDGNKITKTNTGSSRIGSKQLLDTIKKEGAKEGRYEVIKRKGDTVLIAIPVGDDNE